MEINFKSAGVSTRVIDQTGPTGIQPVGVPAGVIGTSQKGPAFVPVTFATTQDFIVNFGLPTDDTPYAPLAVAEWLRNQQAATFLRVLGVGEGKQRESSGINAGKVAGAGFVVGDRQPQTRLGGALGSNAGSNVGGVLGRTYFLGAFMSQSSNSTIFTDANQPGEGVPIVRGVLLAASGVILRLSSSVGVSDNDPAAADVAGTDYSGEITGSVNLNSSRQEFVMLLNGHKGSSATYPNAITASFDVTAPNYLGNVLNTDPLKLEDAGYVLYTHYPIHNNLAVVTGSGIVTVASGANAKGGFEPVAFILTGSATRNSGSTTIPNFENFEDRFKTPKTPWVTSQKFGGKPENLFRVHAISDGAYANQKIKFSIENIAPGTDARPYGTFDLLVRAFGDTDKNRQVLEAHRGLSLDPSSPRYIAKIIGDLHTFYNFDAREGSQKIVVDGDYENRSRYIRVEIADKVANQQVPTSALPFGFRGPPHLVTSGSSPLNGLSDSTYYTKTNPFYDVVQIPVPYRENLTLGSSPNKTVDKGLYWGVQFERKTSATEPNSSTVIESAVNNLTTYFPDYHTDFVNVVVSDNEGAADTTENGILDADRFNNNLFSLENVKVVYNTSTDLADTTQLVSWSYVRGGGIATDSSAGTRALKSDDLTDSTVRQVAKFNFYIQGGFDGVRIFNEDTTNLTNKAIVEEMDNTSRGTNNGPTVIAFDKSLDIIGDATEVDIQLLTIPGIRHSIISDKAILTTEDRFDAVYIMDIEEYDAINTLVTSSNQIQSVRFTSNRFRDRGLNSSFAAAYYPNVELRDELANTVRSVPPSVAVLGAFGLNDAIGHPWFAPAGFTRGALESVNQASVKLNRENLDSLQEVDINPLVAFPNANGVTVWGQKTLLATDSSLERVNVRRLLIAIRREVRQISNRIIFEQGREETLERFEDLVRPVLKRIQDQRGLERFLVKIDTETTTQADIENRTIRGKIYITPTKTLEFLSIDFVLTNAGNFSENAG